MITQAAGVVAQSVRLKQHIRREALVSFSACLGNLPTLILLLKLWHWRRLLTKRF